MTLKERWEKARSSYHYPPLKDPKLVPNLEGGACYDFRRREILVSEDFVRSTCAKSGLDEDACLEGVLVHEVGHYMEFPRTMGTLILAAKMVDDFFYEKDRETRDFILQTYADMANDTASALEERRAGPILGLRGSLQLCEKDKLNHDVRGVMLAYLRHQAGLDAAIDAELEPFFKRMLEIDFLKKDVVNLRVGLYFFGNIIIDILERDGCGGQRRQAKGDGKSARGSLRDTDIDELLKNATPAELREALREIAGKVSKREFDKTVDWLKDRMGEGRVPQAPKKAITVGTSGGDLEIKLGVLEYYRELSKNYPLVVSKKIIDTDSTIRTWSETEKWRPGKDPNLALIGSSGGKLLPGVTKSIRIAETPIRSRDYAVPHLLIVIDSSGSMPNPESYKSYAVLGAYCAARSYHIQGASIGVINFSGNSFYLPYTRDLDAALGSISAFQGGGTVADIDMIRKMLGERTAELYRSDPTRSLGRLPREAIRKELEVAVPDEIFSAESLDVVLFTDGGIYNLGEVLELFEEKAELNRATIVLTHGFSQDLPQFQMRKINILQVEKAEDIPNIVLKETQKGFNSLEWNK